MLKKGGIFLGLLLCMGSVFAQDKTADMFREDNPNLINLNEASAYTGSPMVYIQGVKAPEKANNDMEELQLKLFGTKQVREATKNNLKLSDTTFETPENQVQNYTFETPFHQKIQSAFIPHISNFMTIIQILNQDQIAISENIVLVNTKEDEHWTRTINLPPHAKAQTVSYLQNDKLYPVSLDPQTDSFAFTSPEPLQMGPNHLVLKYNIEYPFQGDQFRLQLLDQESNWPIEQFKTLLLFPTPTKITSSKLLFGTNNLEIPNIYTQQIDAKSNINITINRVVPPRAEINLQMQLDRNSLPIRDDGTIRSLLVGGGIVLLIIYWLAFAWWERKRLTKKYLPQIKYPRTITTLAHQMGTQVTPTKWDQLIHFGQTNGWPLAKLVSEQNTAQNKPVWTKIKTFSANFGALMFEPILGTLILVIGILITPYFMANTKITMPTFGLILFAIFGLIALYIFALKPTRRLYWQKKLNQLMDNTVLTGLTSKQVRQIYPLFVLVQRHEDWRQRLIQTNPKVAQETRLYKEEK